MRALPVLLLAACSAPPDLADLASAEATAGFYALDAQASVPVPLDLEVPPGVVPVGGTASVAVTGLAPGLRAWLLAATQTGTSCPQPIAPECLDLASPFFVVGSGLADATGTARIGVTIPAGAPVGDIVLQAAAVGRGVVGLSDVEVATIAPGLPIDPAAFVEAPARFPMAVQAGDATATGAVLWTYVEGPSAPLRLLVLDDAGVLAADVGVSPVDGFVSAVVDGLPAGTTFSYAFLDEAAGERSPLGRFRTAPAPGTSPVVVFGASSCIDVDFGSPTPLARAAEDDLDFFVFAGDTVYADSATNVPGYRGFWRETFETAPFRALHASTSFLYTWDDHEVTNNWNPETIDPVRRAAATQVYFEHTAQRRDPVAPDRIWRSVRWGDTLEVFVLDTRGERRPSTRTGPNAEYISPAQLAWLEAGLRSSTATFKVILHGVAFTDMPLLYISADDRWEGYAAQRALLADVVDDVPGVLFVAGDFHFGAVMWTGPSGPLRAVPEVLAGPGAQFPNPGALLLTGGQFPYWTLTNNFTRFTANPNTSPPTITVEFVDGAGSVFQTSVLSF